MKTTWEISEKEFRQNAPPVVSFHDYHDFPKEMLISKILFERNRIIQFGHVALFPPFVLLIRN